MAFTNFAAFLAQEQEGKPFTPGQVVAARSLLSRALAAFAYPELKLPKRLERNIIVTPCRPNMIDFHVPSFVGDNEDDVEISINLKQFDMLYYAQEAEFRAFRGFLDEVRRLPANSDGNQDATTTIGPFDIYTSPGEMAKWNEIWGAWEHAHGM